MNLLKRQATRRASALHVPSTNMLQKLERPIMGQRFHLNVLVVLDFQKMLPRWVTMVSARIQCLVQEEVANMTEVWDMATGDVRSKEMGSGARANGGKVRWDLMPLEQISMLMDNIQREDLPQSVTGVMMVNSIGMFQRGSPLMTPERLLIDAVNYNWMQQGGPTDNTLATSLENVISVWGYGLKKYAEFNWAKGMDWSIPIACMIRHILAPKDEPYDEESKELHSAHVVCNAMMLLHYSNYWKSGDDRPLFAFDKG